MGLAPITQDDIDEFTMRTCDRLAWVLHSRTGWPVIAIAVEEEGDDPDAPGLGWIHTGVRQPDGRILDVEGSRELDEWLDARGEWPDALEVWAQEVTDFVVELSSDPATFTASELAHAGRVADTLLASASL